MPIHDQGYRRYAGRRGARGRSWRVIARATIRSNIRQWRVAALVLVAWLPFLVFTGILYAAANIPQASFLAPSPQTFRTFFFCQNFFVFFVAILVGSGLIADDRRANALQIYLSKPLTRLEYIAGKLVGLMAFLAFITWVPAMLLLFLQMMFSGSTAFISANLFLIPAITLFAAAQAFLSAFAILALSSLSNSRRFVAMTYAGVIFFTLAMNRALAGMTGSQAWAWISPWDTLGVIADAVFRVGAKPAIPVPAAVLVVVVLIGASIVVLERRVRGVEVVS